MGFKNYLAENIYVSIENVFYYKNIKRIRFEVVIYTDQTKKHTVASKTYEVGGMARYRRIEGIGKVPPKDPKIGDTWIVQAGATGEWAERENLFAVYERDHWSFWFMGVEELFLFKPTSQFCTFNDKQHKIEPVSLDRIEDIEWWEKWFSPNIIFGVGTNIYRQAYLYLKQFPEFEKTVDC